MRLKSQALGDALAELAKLDQMRRPFVGFSGICTCARRWVSRQGKRYPTSRVSVVPRCGSTMAEEIGSVLVAGLQLRWLFGHDVFISYSRADGLAFASSLAFKLGETKASASADVFGSEPGGENCG